MTPKRVALRLLLASIAIACFIGMAGILGGLGHTGAKAMVTAVIVAIASLVILTCLSAWDMVGAKVVTRLGVIGAVISPIVGLVALWTESESKPLWKLVGAATILAIGGAHGSAMWLVKLPPRAAGLRTLTLAGALLLGVILLGILLDEPRGDGVYELVGLLTIAIAGLSVAIVIISAASRLTSNGLGPAEVCFCPRCGKSIWEPAGTIRCQHCSESYRVELLRVDDLPAAVLKT